MKIRFLSALPLFILVLLFAGCLGGGDPSPAEKFQASVDSDWAWYQQTYGVPGGGLAVYVETPTGIYFSSSGMFAVNQYSRFRIASNTKTFTASAIMLLNQQGLLNIDDTIVSNIPGTTTPYVPDTAEYNLPNKSIITIRELLSHTAGVFDVTNEVVPASCDAPYAGMPYSYYAMLSDPNHQFSPGELIGVDARCQTSYNFTPGAGYKYSNQGYSLLATIIERVSGLTYDQFVIRNLITPNDLTSTSIPMLGTDQKIPVSFAPGYVWEDEKLREVTESNMSLNIAEGNIISTPADLARWIRRLMNAEAGPNAASVAAMKTLTAQSLASGNSYGLGITYTAGLGYGHTGAHEGYLSIMCYDPAKDVTTVAYFNIWDRANLLTAEATLLTQAAKNARAAVGY